MNNDLISRSALLAEYCNGCDALAKKMCDQDICGVAMMINDAPAVDAVEVCRCKDCVWYKPAHFDCDDGKEYPWDGIMRLGERTDGIYVGAKCKHERNTAYGYKDMAFRKADDFCSYGERREDG